MKILCILACVLGILSPTAAVCKRDLGLAVDTTKSLKNITVLKKALVDLVQKFDISENKMHVSLETFDGDATIHNTFNDSNYWSVNAVIDLINKHITDLTNPTRLDRALEKAEDMFTKANGDRTGEVNTLVLFTDGKTSDNTNESELARSVEDLKDKGIFVIAVGIGPKSRKNKKTLNQIAGKNVIMIGDYEGRLDEAMDAVVNLVCICKPNLGLMVDTTKSLRENKRMPDFKVLDALTKTLEYLVKKFNISENRTHVSLETFDGDGTVHNEFNDPSYWSLDTVIELINNTFKSITKLTSPTRLDNALVKANLEMFTEEHGYRSGELNALVVFTDGKTNPKTDEAVFSSSINDLENKGVLLIVVAIGPDQSKPGSIKRLTEIAAGEAENILYVHDFVDDPDAMENALNDVFDKICGS